MEQAIRKISFSFALAALALVGCSKAIVPSSVVVTKNVENLAPFDKVQVQTGLTLNIIQDGGNVAFITSNGNLVEYFDVYVTNGTLVAKLEKGTQIKYNKNTKL